MPKLVYDHSQEVVAWVADKLKIPNPGPSVGIGIAHGFNIIGGCLYNNYHQDNRGRPLSIEISFITLDKRWSTRGIIRELLAYPFAQLKVGRVQLCIAKRNKIARRFVEGLGFKLEGIARKAHHDASDYAVYSMLRHEFLTSRWNQNGKNDPERTGRTRS